MQTSLILARIMGPMMLVMGAGLLFDADGFRAMGRDFMASRPLIYIAGFMTLLLGLLIVTLHNVWSADWRTVITVFGWIMILAGVARMTVPDRLKTIGMRVIENKGFFAGAAVLYLVVGAVLFYFGYLA